MIETCRAGQWMPRVGIKEARSFPARKPSVFGLLPSPTPPRASHCSLKCRSKFPSLALRAFHVSGGTSSVFSPSESPQTSQAAASPDCRCSQDRSLALSLPDFTHAVPLPGTLIPPVYGNPTPHSSFKRPCTKGALSLTSLLPSLLCKFGINHVFLSASIALSQHLHHGPVSQLQSSSE